ncbi:DUF4199 domain-containing protein [Dysgonomonas sp. 511]|uniref:DUF4199 domain-containing protein n=1 Tax=Dysgonomonas sp. 511 TaxID=2302930 RepID=UPI0013D30BF3|nr:DUF4199 domain-containing protein [Dysgonomonas sp. 511]NDV79578.1 DUF4199 domain-containing protein [Dysgonomonas sp. 511]
MENDRKIESGLAALNRYAMYYGLLLGAFWVFRYIFLIIAGAGVSDRFLFLYYLMNIGTFLLIYVFYTRYRFSGQVGQHKLVYSILFMLLMCFYASFLEGAMMYAHYKFIDPPYFANMVSNVLNSVETYGKTGLVTEEQYLQIKDQLIAIYSSKIFYIIVEFLKNLFLGLFMGIVLSLIIATKKN